MAIDANQGLIDLYCLRTKRQRRRSLKEDKEKQLRELYYHEQELRVAKRNLPMVPLEQPYQRGWKRTFVLKEDQRTIETAPFYEQLLEKINTVQYHNDKRFTRRIKRRIKRKKVYEDIPQDLKQFDLYEWNNPKMPLTERERELFQLELVCMPRTDVLCWMYVFSEPWRFVLQIRPHIIYEVQMTDSALEQQLAEAGYRLDHAHLRPIADRMILGRANYKWITKRPQLNPIKNKPLHTILDEAANTEQQNK